MTTVVRVHQTPPTIGWGQLIEAGVHDMRSRSGARRLRTCIIVTAVSLLTVAVLPAGAGAGDRRADEVISAERFLTELFSMSRTRGPVPKFDYRGRCPKAGNYVVHMAYPPESTSTPGGSPNAVRFGGSSQGVVEGSFVAPEGLFPPGPHTVDFGCAWDGYRNLLFTTRTFCVTDPTAVVDPCGGGRAGLLRVIPDLSQIAKLRIEQIAEQVVAVPPSTPPGACPEGAWSLDFVATQYVKTEGDITGHVTLAILHDGTWSFTGTAALTQGFTGFLFDSRGPWSRGGSPDVVTFAGPFGAGTSYAGSTYGTAVPGTPGDYTATCDGNRLTVTGSNGFPVIFNKEKEG